MEIECPCCQHPVKLTGDEHTATLSDFLGRASIECPNCGIVTLGSEPGETIAHAPSVSNNAHSPDGGHRREVGHFALQRILGQGAFGAVYLAEDVDLGRQVALKLPISRDGETVNLIHEAQAAAKLRHPNIVAVYEAGTVDGQVYIASEYIDGLNLRDLLSAGKPSVERAVQLLIPIAHALHFAHEQGIVHRDVKPANIMLSSDGKPYIADFGIAKRISADATISTEGRIMGTARYMSPEQASGRTQETDQRSDIYALGVILFEMLTGDVPFRGNVRAVLHNKVFDEAPSPRSLDSSIPKDLETLCMRCLDREPSRRFDNAALLAAELERFANDEPIQARPVSRLERGWRWCRRRPAISALTMALSLALLIGVAGIGMLGWHATRHAEQTERALYRAQMNLCAEYLEQGDIAGLKLTLEQFPQESLEKHPAFTWRYYDRLLSPYQSLVNQGVPVANVAISHDGRLLASHGAEDTIYIWDNRTNEPTTKLKMDDTTINRVVFSPTSSHLAAGCVDGMFHIWNPLRSDLPIQSNKHGPSVQIIEYSPNGRSIVTCGAQGAARLWDVQTEKIIHEFPAGMSGAKDIRFTPDGLGLAVVSNDGRLRIWDVAAKEIQHQFSIDESIAHFCFSADGQRLVTGNGLGRIEVWDVAQGASIGSFTTSLGPIGDMATLRRSALIAICGTSGKTYLIDTDALNVVRSMRTHNLSFGTLAVSANGESIAIGSGDGTIKVLEVEKLATRDVVWHNTHVRAIDFLASDQQLVAGTGDGQLLVIDVSTGEVTSQDANHSPSRTGEKNKDEPSPPPRDLRSVSADNAGLRIATVAQSEVVIRETESNKNQIVRVPKTGVLSAQFTEDNRHLVVVTRQHVFIYEDGEWLKPTVEIEAADAEIRSTCISPDGQSIVLGTSRSQVDIYNLSDGKPRRPSLKLNAIPRAMAMTGDSQLVVGNDLGNIEFWDLVDGKRRATVKAHTSRINAVAAFPDGQSVVTAGRDRDVKIWDVQSTERITNLVGHPRQVFGIAISSDGKTMATCGLAGDIRIWRTE